MKPPTLNVYVGTYELARALADQRITIGEAQYRFGVAITATTGRYLITAFRLDVANDIDKNRPGF